MKWSKIFHVFQVLGTAAAAVVSEVFVMSPFAHLAWAPVAVAVAHAVYHVAAAPAPAPAPAN